MALDLIGERFGRLVVLKKVGNDKWRHTQWLCQCVCGKEKIILGYDLRSGHTKSCGCLVIKHGHYRNNKRSRIYRSWEGMIGRCTNLNDKDYQSYGGRGITVCGRWRKFVNFLEDMGEPSTQQHSIDRINNDKGYYKENYRWATKKEQQRNTRGNRLITHNNKTQCLIEWAEEFGINYSTLQGRLSRGWLIEKALTTPVQKRRK